MNRDEIRRGQRFGFGANWRAFLDTLNESRVENACTALREMLQRDRLDGLRFLDVGSGSGLSSLAARRLGAIVHSFDYDPDSVACTEALRRQYFAHDGAWTIEQGSVLDEQYMRSLPTFDVVYSWGVLHHTGEMWRAISLALERVAVGGQLELAIYNDQGAESVWWRDVKKRYNALPQALRPLYVARVMGPRELRALFGAVRTGTIRAWWDSWARYQSKRGMSRIHDMVDWVGGYPFEVAKPEELIHFCLERGFALTRLKTVGNGLGCNDFVFRRVDRGGGL